MLRLTPLGKLIIGAIVLAIIYFFILPLFTPGSTQKSGMEEERGVKVTVFYTTFDLKSVEVVEALVELSKEKALQERFSYVVLDMHKNREEAKRKGVSVTPTIFINETKYEEFKGKNWLRDKIKKASGG